MLIQIKPVWFSISEGTVVKLYLQRWKEWDYLPQKMKYLGGKLELSYHKPYWELPFHEIGGDMVLRKVNQWRWHYEDIPSCSSGCLEQNFVDSRRLCWGSKFRTLRNVQCLPFLVKVMCLSKVVISLTSSRESRVAVFSCLDKHTQNIWKSTVTHFWG